MAEVDRIAGRADGKEWITIAPWVDPENMPVTSVLRRLFTARGPKVPEVTWIAANGSEPAQLGVMHATGSDAAGRIAEAAVEVPETWILVSDHTKRGLLYAVAPGTKARTVVDTAVALGAALAAVPTDDRWVAEVSST